MRIITQKEHKPHKRRSRRIPVFLLIISLLLGHLNSGFMVAYATGGDSATFRIGDNVKASLNSGVLTLSGSGDTYDYNADTAPFQEYGESIHTLIIENGITYIGSCLFYNLGNLGGELILPESITGFGDYAFSGDSLEEASRFSLIRNLFQSAEIVKDIKPEQSTEPDSEMSDYETESAEQTEEAADATESDIMQTETEETGQQGSGTETAQQESSEDETEKQESTEAETEKQESTEGEKARPEASETETSQEPEKEEGTAAGTEAERKSENIIPAEEQQDNGIDSTSQTVLNDNKSKAASPLLQYLMGQPFVLTAYAAPSAENTSEDNVNTGESEEKNTVHDTVAYEDDKSVTETEITESTAVDTKLPEKEEESADITSVSTEKSTEESKKHKAETITKQNIENPDTLFHKGQDGAVICTSENSTFLEAALSSGYQLADRIIVVTLDDTEELELPAVNGKIILPECPEAISDFHKEDVFFTYEFAGWAEAKTEDISAAAMPGEAFNVGEAENISLYSVWETVSKYHFKVDARLNSETAVYTLLDGNTDGEVSAPEGYIFSYQWQISKRGDEESADWRDIDGAVDVKYSRLAEASDSEMQFRCVVTAVKLTCMRTLNEPVTLYSDAVDAAVEVKTVYVDQSKGSDANDGGSKEQPVKTFDQAASLLRKKEDGGSVDNNVIIVIGTYKLYDKNIFQGNSCPVTIKGEEGSILKGNLDQSPTNDYPLELQNDICFESIKIENINHIYGNGHDITFNRNVTSPIDLPFYLYGSGQNQLTSSVGKIAVYSGYISRIVGYVRSSTSIDVTGKAAHIIVGGSAVVQTIVAGSASGAVKNAEVTIEIKGGKVTSLLGGNQGYNTNASPFSGNTDINISGGKIENIWSAGTGRNASIPTFLGNMKINVTGGQIDNIYGAGSAAYVISTTDVRSRIDINMTGGTIKSIYAAGKGGDPLVKEKTAEGKDYNFPDSTPQTSFGSLSGDINITLNGGTVTGNIYAGGEGYKPKEGEPVYSQKNAFLDGNAVITIKGDSIVKGNIYGGGKGITDADYQESARVESSSSVKVKIESGTVEGNVFGGGENAIMRCSTSVEISGGLLKGNVYGGGEHGIVEQKTAISLSNGTVNGSVYGGALGVPGEKLVYGGATVNMTGGWIRGNLYGGSELSDDGPKDAGTKETVPKDLVFVNLVGGTVSGNVFGGGYKGTVNGSTHLHIGQYAPDDCNYYKNNSKEKPSLEASALSVEGSVYAGGDYGGGGTIDYTTITVTGTSHVYVDGTGYDTGGGVDTVPYMAIAGGVFGSGASCDAGSTRLVTLENYGSPVKAGSAVNGATRTLTAIQRADRVLLNNSHVRLTGRSDVANSNQTALYSLNRIGDHEGVDSSIERGLVLQGGSTLVLDSEVIEMANFYSRDKGGNAVELGKISETPNTIRFEAGTVFRVSYTKQQEGAEKDEEVFGKVSGYAYMLAGNTADAYAYARMKNENNNNEDGGFAAPGSTEELTYYNVTDMPYRYWKLGQDNAKAERYTVLTAQTLESGFDKEGYSVAKGTIDLPPVDKESTYTINKVTLPTGTGLKLAEAAKNKGGEWVTSEINIESGNFPIKLQDEKEIINNAPLNTFGLFMYAGSNFNREVQKGKIISDSSSASSGNNSIINQNTPSTLPVGTPQIEFYLTYYNNGISISRSLGTVIVELKRDDGALINMNIEIVTKASALADQTVDLYATQNGSYTGSLTIPSGDSRSLTLNGVKVKTSGDSSAGTLVSKNSGLTGNNFSITMQPKKSQGWNSADLMTEPFDLYGYTEEKKIGTTDSRYEADIEFTLRNAAGFKAKTSDQVVLILKDSGEEITVTLNIHWKESVVSKVGIMPGKQYNQMSSEEASVAASQESSITAEFTLGSAEDTGNLWLELRKKDSPERIQLSARTWLTLCSGTDFYCYQVSGNETDNKIQLSQFIKMWETSAMSGTIADGTKLKVIMDFGSAVSKLSPGEYSLRLRNEQSADSMGADFTLNNSSAGAAMSIEQGDEINSQKIKLSINMASDTRLAEGAGVVFSTSGEKSFPEGVIFRYNSKEYCPVGGKVYISVKAKEYSGIEVEMDTTNSAGISEGSYTFTLQANIYPAGQSSGAVESSAIKTETAVTIAAKPDYSIKVSLAGENAGRIVKRGTVLEFLAEYNVKNIQTSPIAIKVDLQKKNNGSYEGITQQWTVTGNNQITGSNSGGTQNITVTVPSENMIPGTYRLLFTLGDQQVPYNIIVEE